MSTPWFRFYSKTLIDRRFKHVANEIAIPKASVIGAWTILLTLANDSPEQGKLLSTDCEGPCPWYVSDFAGIFGCPSQTARDICIQFKRMNLISLADGVWEIVGWKAYEIPRADTDYRRVAIFERDDYRCRYCGKTAEHIDHVVPRCQGGTGEPGNLVAACAHCNLSKGGRTPEQAGMVLL